MPALRLRVETVLLLTCLYVVGTANLPFWRLALGSRPIADLHSVAWLGALAAILVALHFILLAPLAWRWSTKPLLAAFLLISAGAAWFEQRYGVVLDRAMLRNVLHTETQEAAELLSPGLLIHLALFGVLPALLLTLLPLRRDPAPAALRWRVASMALAMAILLGAGLGVSSQLAALLRNHREARFLVTPANVLVGAGRVLLDDAAASTAVREPIAPDARRARSATAARPLVAVVVVGETVRWANWGLGGYRRQTTPELAERGAIELGPALACGTSTEISVPCLFSDLDRAHFDLAAARRRESVLHLLERVGVHTVWRDNQTGCKGVCDGLASERIAPDVDPALCADGGCLDAALLHDLESLLASTPRDLVLVLHPIGNHGPAYYRRYPAAFEHYRPACRSNELGDCAQDSIVNAYDNAVRYTDRVLSDLIDRLQRQRSHDAVLLYVSDHGESLGERGLWLHGVPNFLAPEVQTRVPFMLWLGESFEARSGIEPSCLAERKAGTLSHDNLFHSLLGLFEVQTRLYQPSLDLFRACRSNVADIGRGTAQRS